jgi:hypothetical protein
VISTKKTAIAQAKIDTLLVRRLLCSSNKKILVFRNGTKMKVRCLSSLCLATKIFSSLWNEPVGPMWKFLRPRAAALIQKLVHSAAVVTDSGAENSRAWLDLYVANVISAYQLTRFAPLTVIVTYLKDSWWEISVMCIYVYIWQPSYTIRIFT